MKMDVYVREISYGWVSVDVDCDDDINDAAMDEYMAGKVDWEESEFDVQSYKPAKKWD